jgi:hypothetical protein
VFELGLGDIHRHRHGLGLGHGTSRAIVVGMDIRMGARVDWFLSWDNGTGAGKSMMELSPGPVAGHVGVR